MRSVDLPLPLHLTPSGSICIGGQEGVGNDMPDVTTYDMPDVSTHDMQDVTTYDMRDVTTYDIRVSLPMT